MSVWCEPTLRWTSVYLWRFVLFFRSFSLHVALFAVSVWKLVADDVKRLQHCCGTQDEYWDPTPTPPMDQEVCCRMYSICISCTFLASNVPLQHECTWHQHNQLPHFFVSSRHTCSGSLIPDYLLDINWLSPMDLAVVPLLRPPKNYLIDRSIHRRYMMAYCCWWHSTAPRTPQVSLWFSLYGGVSFRSPAPSVNCSHLDYTGFAYLHGRTFCI